MAGVICIPPPALLSQYFLIQKPNLGWVELEAKDIFLLNSSLLQNCASVI